MPNDIRSYFKPTSSVPKKESFVKSHSNLKHNSSSEEIIADTPIKKKIKQSDVKKRKAILISDSDSDSESKFIKKSKFVDKSKPNLKKVNVADVFGCSSIKQSEVKVEDKVKVKNAFEQKNKHVNTEVGIHDDNDFEKSLLELDEDILLQKADQLNKSKEVYKSEGNLSIENSILTTIQSDKKELNEYNINNAVSNVNFKKVASKCFPDETAVYTDQEKYEKKIQAAQLYQKYLHRGRPPHYASKEFPNGTSNCLKNLCFLRTGVLDSLDDFEVDELAQKHGGRTVKSVSKKVDYVIAGEEPGPAKLEKAKNYNIPIITEDEFLDIILIKSGKKRHYTTCDSTILDIIEKGGNVSESSPPERNKSPKYIKTSSKDKSISPQKKLKLEKLETRSVIETESVEKSPKYTKTSSKDKSVSPQKKIKLEKLETSNVIKIESVENDSAKKNAAIDNNTLPLTEKYKPQDIKAIVGQQGDKSNMKKLLNWLKDWRKPSDKRSQSFYAAALLSGPPGVGKTTTATLVAKNLGFDVVEFNASDTRSKKLLHEEVSQLLSTKTIAGFVKDGSEPTKKRVLLMDEVDGMAGNEDRGGMQELINLIKNTSIPIICMCNDRSHPKVRSLVNYCLDLRFQRPRMEQIRAFLMTICCRENLKVPPNALSEIIIGAGMDIRQSLNNLSMWTTGDKCLSVETAQREATLAKKDTVLSPWDVFRKVFTKKEHENMSVTERGRLFFYDYSIAPIFMQENYLRVVPNSPRNQVLSRILKAAESFSYSDIIGRQIRSSNNWSLLEVESMFVTVIPGTYMGGYVSGQVNFPSWLGRNSKRLRYERTVTEIQNHMKTRITASRFSVNLDYVSHLRYKILKPLIVKGIDGISETIEVMKAYNLSREDFDNILELAQWKGTRNPASLLETKVKTAFTRAFNKEGISLPKKRRKMPAEDYVDKEWPEEGEDDEEEDADDITKDDLILKKKKPTKAKKSKETESASTSEKKVAKGKKKKAGK